jgi:hypothetical protein
VQLGFENKKQTIWAAGLGAVAVLAVAYAVSQLTGSSTSTSNAQAAAPVATHATRATPRPGTKPGKKPRVANLDPTLRLDLLASSEQTVYEGNGRNIFVSQADDVVIPKPGAPGVTDAAKGEVGYRPPTAPPAPPIPLKFYGFASSPGEQKKIFLKSASGEDVWVAGEGEIVNRRYKVIRISPTSVEIQDMVYSGPPQNIPLTQG